MVLLGRRLADVREDCRTMKKEQAMVALGVMRIEVE
jgi:hypothetical protein